MLIRALLMASAAALLAAPAMADSPTLNRIRAAGTLKCGVVSTPEDWNKTDLHGTLTPLGIEMCKAVAVAALGPKAAATIVSYVSELQAEEGLSKGDVDVAMGLSVEATAMWHWAIAFGPPIFYDAQGFVVRKDANAHTMADLAGMNVCVVNGTDNEAILEARMAARGIAFNPLSFQEEGEMDDGLAVRHCDAISAMLSRIAQTKATYGRQIGGDTVLPDVLTLSPVAPAYRQGDAQWGMIVDWTIHSLVQAEASGITQANVGALATSDDPVVLRVIGVDWATSRALGLESHDWAAQVVAVVGNYGEIYERTVGTQSNLRLPRGLNRLWLDGGLMHPLPVQ
jgi:general L-amino acid transport system substrate-binding protein